MKIAAITRFKNGALWQALKQAGWSQSELARRSGIDASRIGEYCNLRRIPTPEAKQLIQNTFGNVGVYFDIEAAWPTEFIPLDTDAVIEQVQDVPINSLSFSTPALLPDSANLDEIIDKARVHYKDPLDFDLLLAHYVDGATFEALAKPLKVTRERVRQRINKVLRVIRAHLPTGDKNTLNDVDPSDIASSVKHYQAKIQSRGRDYIEALRKANNRAEHAAGRTKNEKCLECGFYLPRNIDNFCPNCVRLYLELHPPPASASPSQKIGYWNRIKFGQKG